MNEILLREEKKARRLRMAKYSFSSRDKCVCVLEGIMGHVDVSPLISISSRSVNKSHHSYFMTPALFDARILTVQCMPQKLLSKGIHISHT